MAYTIRQMAKLAGISTRALRYYDEIGLLKPARNQESQYRTYGAQEVDALQQILFYKALGMELSAIKEIMISPEFDFKQALKAHHTQLLEKRLQIDQLIETVEKTLNHAEGRQTLSDLEKFEGFKKQMIEEHEVKYGQEARSRYGGEAVDAANEKIMARSPEIQAEVEKLEKAILEELEAAFETGDPAGEQAQNVAKMHKAWLLHYWTAYTPKAHAGLAQMYVDDLRFTAYYDRNKPGMAAFLRDAIHIYTGQNK